MGTYEVTDSSARVHLWQAVWEVSSCLSGNDLLFLFYWFKFDLYFILMVCVVSLLQFSSLGSLDEKWMTEFASSMSAGMTEDKKPLGLGKPLIIWPSVEDVRCSLEVLQTNLTLNLFAIKVSFIEKWVLIIGSPWNITECHEKSTSNHNKENAFFNSKIGDPKLRKNLWHDSSGLWYIKLFYLVVNLVLSSVPSVFWTDLAVTVWSHCFLETIQFHFR